MTRNKIRVGQVWVSKTDGRMLFIGKKHDGMSWNTTNNFSSQSHRITDFNIQRFYTLLEEDPGKVKDLIETSPENVKVLKYTNATFKTKPWYLPAKLHKWLLSELIDIHEVRIKD